MIFYEFPKRFSIIHADLNRSVWILKRLLTYPGGQAKSDPFDEELSSAFVVPLRGRG